MTAFTTHSAKFVNLFTEQNFADQNQPNFEQKFEQNVLFIGKKKF